MAEKTLRGRLEIFVIASGDAGENERMAANHDVPMLIDERGGVFSDFRLIATPSGIEVDSEGRGGARPLVAGAPGIEAMIRASPKRARAASAV